MARCGGNLALRDHAENGEDVHLFEQERQGLRYVGQFVCAGYDERENVPDRNGDPRRAIVFQLVALDGEVDAVPGDGILASDERWTLPLDELRARASARIARQPEPSQGKRTLYRRSRALRAYVLRRAEGVCEGCGDPAPFVTREGRPYLEPHHTRRLSDGGPDDYHHVIALCPTCHRRVHHGQDGDAYNVELQAATTDD